MGIMKFRGMKAKSALVFACTLTGAWAQDLPLSPNDLTNGILSPQNLTCSPSVPSQDGSLEDLLRSLPVYQDLPFAKKLELQNQARTRLAQLEPIYFDCEGGETRLSLTKDDPAQEEAQTLLIQQKWQESAHGPITTSTSEEYLSVLKVTADKIILHRPMAIQDEKRIQKGLKVLNPTNTVSFSDLSEVVIIEQIPGKPQKIQINSYLWNRKTGANIPTEAPKILVESEDMKCRADALAAKTARKARQAQNASKEIPLATDPLRSAIQALRWMGISEPAIGVIERKWFAQRGEPGADLAFLDGDSGRQAMLKVLAKLVDLAEKDPTAKMDGEKLAKIRKELQKINYADQNAAVITKLAKAALGLTHAVLNKIETSVAKKTQDATEALAVADSEEYRIRIEFSDNQYIKENIAQDFKRTQARQFQLKEALERAKVAATKAQKAYDEATFKEWGGHAEKLRNAISDVSILETHLKKISESLDTASARYREREANRLKAESELPAAVEKKGQLRKSATVWTTWKNRLSNSSATIQGWIKSFSDLGEKQSKLQDKAKAPRLEEIEKIKDSLSRNLESDSPAIALLENGKEYAALMGSKDDPTKLRLEIRDRETHLAKATIRIQSVESGGRPALAFIADKTSNIGARKILAMKLLQWDDRANPMSLGDALRMTAVGIENTREAVQSRTDITSLDDFPKMVGALRRMGYLPEDLNQLKVRAIVSPEMIANKEEQLGLPSRTLKGYSDGNPRGVFEDLLPEKAPGEMVRWMEEKGDDRVVVLAQDPQADSSVAMHELVHHLEKMRALPKGVVEDPRMQIAKNKDETPDQRKARGREEVLNALRNSATYRDLFESYLQDQRVSMRIQDAMQRQLAQEPAADEARREALQNQLREKAQTQFESKSEFSSTLERTLGSLQKDWEYLQKPSEQRAFRAEVSYLKHELKLSETEVLSRMANGSPYREVLFKKWYQEL